MARNLPELLKEIKELVGSKYSWFSEEHEGKIDIQVVDDAEDDVREMIKKSGFKIVDEFWFSGSNYDGCKFTIKVEKEKKTKDLPFTQIYVTTKAGNDFIYPVEDIDGDYAITINGYHKIPLKVLDTDKPWHGNYYYTYIK